MSNYSTRQAARTLGLGLATLNRLIAGKKIPIPRLIEVGTVKVRLWSQQDIEKVQKILPKLKNGRKTRYQKKQGTAKTKPKTKKKPQPKAAVPHKKEK